MSDLFSQGLRMCLSIPTAAISLAPSFCKRPWALTSVTSLASEILSLSYPTSTLIGRNAVSEVGDYVDWYDLQEDTDIFREVCSHWRAGDYLNVVNSIAVLGANFNFLKDIANNIGLLDATAISAKLGSFTLFGRAPFEGAVTLGLAPFSNVMIFIAKTTACLSQLRAIRKEIHEGTFSWKDLHIWRHVTHAAFFGLGAAVQVNEFAIRFFPAARSALPILILARKVANLSRWYVIISQAAIPETQAEALDRQAGELKTKKARAEALEARKQLPLLKRGLLRVADAGFYAWQGVSQLNGRTVGIDAMAGLVSNIGLSRQYYYNGQGISTPRTDDTVAWLGRIHQTIANGPMAIIAWGGLLEAINRPAGIARKLTIFQDASFVTEVFGRTIGLMQMVEQWGGGTVTTLARLDLEVFGGIAARVGASPLFTLCKIGTLNNLKNSMLILTSLLRIAQASVTFYHTFSEQDDTVKQTTQFRYATQIFLLTCANESFKAIGMIYFGVGIPGIVIGIVSASLQMSKELFTMHYIGENGKFRTFEHLSV